MYNFKRELSSTIGEWLRENENGAAAMTLWLKSLFDNILRTRGSAVSIYVLASLLIEPFSDEMNTRLKLERNICTKLRPPGTCVRGKQYGSCAFISRLSLALRNQNCIHGLVVHGGVACHEASGSSEGLCKDNSSILEVLWSKILPELRLER
jgi:hypothetical protein